MKEYFAMETLSDGKTLLVPGVSVVPYSFNLPVQRHGIHIFLQMKSLQQGDLIVGAKHGVEFSSVSTSPLALASHLQHLFLRGGGRMFRGTVRHLDEIVHGGIASFQRLRDGILPEDGVVPTAILVCVGMGARFLGGVEDKTLQPVQFPVLQLRLPGVTEGRAFYDDYQTPTLFLVPLGDGNVSTCRQCRSIGGLMEKRRSSGHHWRVLREGRLVSSHLASSDCEFVSLIQVTQGRQAYEGKSRTVAEGGSSPMSRPGPTRRSFAHPLGRS